MGLAEVDQVLFSEPVIAKLNGKHRLSEADVRWVIAHADRAGWDDNPIHGHRLLVEGSTEYGRKVRVTLFPSDVPRLFWCGTAWVC